MRSYLVPAYDPAEPKTSAALMLFASVLGDGIASRLSKNLQLEQKIAIGTGAWYSPQSRDVTSLTMYGVPGPGNTLEDIEAALDTQLAELMETGPTQEELDRMKRVLRAQRIFALDNQSSQARRYGAALSMGFSIEDVQNWPDVVESVTIEDIRKAAQAHIDLNASVTGTLMRGEAS